MSMNDEGAGEVLAKKGSLKEALGKLTGDDALEAQGALEQEVARRNQAEREEVQREAAPEDADEERR